MVRDIEFKWQYWAGGVMIHEDKAKVTVIQVNLDAEGISDALEYTTGTFVIINDDDDDEDGTTDKNETTGNVVGEQSSVSSCSRRNHSDALAMRESGNWQR